MFSDLHLGHIPTKIKEICAKTLNKYVKYIVLHMLNIKKYIYVQTITHKY